MKKREIYRLCSLCLVLILLAGCAASPKEVVGRSPYYPQAEAVLNELPNDGAITDFKAVYTMLTDLPAEEEAFLERLSEAKAVCVARGWSLKYADYYLSLAASEKFDRNQVEMYRTNGAFEDLELLAQEAVYPLLMKQYGESVCRVPDLSEQAVLDGMASTGFSELKEEWASYDGMTRSWVNPQEPTLGECILKTYPNGSVEFLEVPVVRHSTPMNATGITEFFVQNAQRQKASAGARFFHMLDSLQGFSVGKPLLSLVYTPEDLAALEQTLRSMELSEIWAHDRLSYEAAPGDGEEYEQAQVVFRFRDTFLQVNFGLNQISLRIRGTNEVNDYSRRVHTLRCGLSSSQKAVSLAEEYEAYLSGDSAVSSVPKPYMIDLDALLAEKK